MAPLRLKRHVRRAIPKTEMRTYTTPEDAAMSGSAASYFRVVASRTEGDLAYVLLDAGSAGQPYLYGVNCYRRDGHWYEGSSGNGGGWSATDPDGDLGTWSLWNDVSRDTDRVRVEFRDEVSEHPVDDGAYLVVWFNQPSHIVPWVTALRVNGTWVPQLDWRWLWDEMMDDTA